MLSANNKFMIEFHRKIILASVNVVIVNGYWNPQFYHRVKLKKHAMSPTAMHNDIVVFLIIWFSKISKFVNQKTIPFRIDVVNTQHTFAIMKWIG